MNCRMWNCRLTSLPVARWLVADRPRCPRRSRRRTSFLTWVKRRVSCRLPSFRLLTCRMWKCRPSRKSSSRYPQARGTFGTNSANNNNVLGLFFLKMCGERTRGTKNTCHAANPKLRPRSHFRKRKKIILLTHKRKIRTCCQSSSMVGTVWKGRSFKTFSTSSKIVFSGKRTSAIFSTSKHSGVKLSLSVLFLRTLSKLD